MGALRHIEVPAAVQTLQQKRRSDDELVRACLAGDEDAWSALIDRYKNLIYSVPVRSGLSPQDAADVFQSVCLQLFSELPKLRRANSLRSWLVVVTTHKVYEVAKQNRRRRADALEDSTGDLPDVADSAVLAPSVLEELERDQQIRDAIEGLSPRCRQLVHLLFFEQPARPYKEIAARLGIATGSIGFIRGRCLARLERALRLLNLR